MNKRLDRGEFINDPIVTAHPYKKNQFMVFTKTGIYLLDNKPTKGKKKKK